MGWFRRKKRYTGLRGVIAGVCMAVISYAFGWLFYAVIFMKETEKYKHVWRPMDSNIWKVGLPLTHILEGLLLSLGYALLYKGIPGKGFKKGVMFGLIVWGISRFAGELFMYVMAPVSFTIAAIGWMHGIVTLVLGGLVIAAIYRKSLD